MGWTGESKLSGLDEKLDNSEFIRIQNQISQRQNFIFTFTCYIIWENTFQWCWELFNTVICVVLCEYLVNNPASDTHAIKNGHVNNGGHSSIIDGLGAVRPHVWTLCQVDVAGRKTGRRQEG